MLDEDDWRMLRGIESWLEVFFDTLSGVGDTAHSKHLELLVSNGACISRLREVQNHVPSLRDAIQRSINVLDLTDRGTQFYWVNASLIRKSLILHKAGVDTFPVMDPTIKCSKFDIALERDPHFVREFRRDFQNRVSYLCQRWLFLYLLFLQDVGQITRKHACLYTLGKVE